MIEHFVVHGKWGQTPRDMRNILEVEEIQEILDHLEAFGIVRWEESLRCPECKEGRWGMIAGHYKCLGCGHAFKREDALIEREYVLNRDSDLVPSLGGLVRDLASQMGRAIAKREMVDKMRRRAGGRDRL